MIRSILIFIFFIKVMFVSAQEEMSVLFIGNSFTFMNDMPFTFQKMALSAGFNLYVDTVVEGGKDLRFHNARTQTFEKIKSRQWDFVIVQGHSNEFAAPDQKVDSLSLPHLMSIVSAIRENSPCSEIILYMTWAYKFGNNRWSPIATYELMQDKIKYNYLRIAELLNVKIAPVGAVWKQFIIENKDVDLYDPDLHHPSEIGSYVSAATFFSVITGSNSIGNLYNPGFDSTIALKIQEKASSVVLNYLATWRLNYSNYLLQPGFDLIINCTDVQIISNARGSEFTKYEISNGLGFTGENYEIQLSSPGKYSITQTVYGACRTRKLTREFEIK